MNRSADLVDENKLAKVHEYSRGCFNISLRTASGTFDSSSKSSSVEKTIDKSTVFDALVFHLVS